MGSRAKLGRQRKLTNHDVATTVAARIWVQSGKITGLVAFFFFPYGWKMG
jgi:hypothetical protein